jgi:hypothetical protein
LERFLKDSFIISVSAFLELIEGSLVVRIVWWSRLVLKRFLRCFWHSLSWNWSSLAAFLLFCSDLCSAVTNKISWCQQTMIC